MGGVNVFVSEGKRVCHYGVGGGANLIIVLIGVEFLETKIRCSKFSFIPGQSMNLSLHENSNRGLIPT